MVFKIKKEISSILNIAEKMGHFRGQKCKKEKLREYKQKQRQDKSRTNKWTNGPNKS